MKTIKTFGEFNHRRYSNPWVCAVTPAGKLNFDNKVGGYTGRYGAGEAGELYITAPVEGKVYAYGQKDYRKSSESWYYYIQYKDGEFHKISKTELLSALNS